MAETYSSIRVAAFGDEDVLRLETLPASGLVLGDKQVLVRVHFAGVNPVETYIRSGKYARLPVLPYTPGSDVAGVVAAVGNGVTKFSVGQRVFSLRCLSGAYAELCVCAEEHLGVLPDSISFAQGAALGVPFFTAHRALILKGQAKQGDKVFVHGATGAVGTACVQMAKMIGATVVASGGSEEGRALLKSLGADVILDHTAPNYLQGLENVDVCVEMLANKNLGADLKVCARGARVVVVGSRGLTEIDPRDIMSRELIVTAVALMLSSESEFDEAKDWIVKGLATKALSPIVGPEFPLAKANEAHKDVMAHESGSKGKVVLRVRDD